MGLTRDKEEAAGVGVDMVLHLKGDIVVVDTTSKVVVVDSIKVRMVERKGADLIASDFFQTF